jgi:hypothetical protein
MAIRSKPNWKLLDRLLPIFEKEGWSHAQIADDWGISFATLEKHLTQEVLMSAKERDIDWQRFDELKAQGLSYGKIGKQMDIPEATIRQRAQRREREHQSTPAENQETPEVHPSTPYEAELLTEHPSTPEPTEILPDEQYTQEHLSTPEVHPEMSLPHTSTAHSGVPARQEWPAEVPSVHPGTPTADDWELWNTIKARWLEVEKMLAERHTRQALFSTPAGTPRHTVKKTYVVDTYYVELIDRHTKEHRLDLKDVLNAAFHRFFEQEGYLTE